MQILSYYIKSRNGKLSQPIHSYQQSWKKALYSQLHSFTLLLREQTKNEVNVISGSVLHIDAQNFLKLARARTKETNQPVPTPSMNEQSLYLIHIVSSAYQ